MLNESVQERLHREHKERQARMTEAARPPRALPAPPAPLPVLYAATPAERPRIRVAEIQAAVAARFGIGVADIIGPRRWSECARPRMIATHLALKLCPHLSLPVIGRAFNRDHSTLIYTRDKMKRVLSVDRTLAADVEELLALIASAAAAVPVPPPMIARRPLSFVPPPPRNDLTGLRFGRLVVMGQEGRAVRISPKRLDRFWKCQCDCGATKIRRGAYLNEKKDYVKSCGCVARENASAAMTAWNERRRAKESAHVG